MKAMKMLICGRVTQLNCVDRMNVELRATEKVNCDDDGHVSYQELVYVEYPSSSYWWFDGST